MTAILEPDVGHLAIVQTMLHGSVAFKSFEDLNAHIAASPHEFAVVIGPTVDVDAATAFAKWARISRPDLGVILLRRTVDHDVLTTALRSGMREVVEANDLAGITTAVHRARSVASEIAKTIEVEAQAAASSAMAQAKADVAAAQAAADMPQGKVLTVFSTKGGVGKSLIATNTAVALSDAGHNVCLIDLDVNSGDVAIMLQLTPARTINDLVAFNGMIDEVALESILTRHSKRLAIVAAPVRLDSPDHATAVDIGTMIDTLKGMFDYVVVDTSGVFDDNALTALDRTDTIVLVATLDIPALKGLKLATGTLDLLNFPRDTWKFVLNRADGKVGLTTDEFESTVGLKADISLVSSREVLSAVNRGEALVRAYPSHPNSKAIVAFAHSFTNVDATQSEGHKVSGGRLRLRRG
ncbi:MULTISPECIES: AAA family ATPase [Nocardioides]|uniref:AAA family ATPase n=1 Tax=Nocardioides TaxID=1839 RepID=UPI000330C5F0|nr:MULTISPECIES: P-loop NTPase [Nocardioides]EON23341.1 Flp pilus assembly protein ATPase CpaE-like [Nocardioides sp. CF8]